MHQNLIEFHLPLLFKTVFGSLPTAVYVVLLIGGLVLMFLPDPRRAQGGGTGGAETANAGRGLVLGLFLVGFGLFVLGLLGVGVQALNNDETEFEAFTELSHTIAEAEGGLDTVVANPRGASDLARDLNNRILLRRDPRIGDPEWKDTIAFERAESLRVALNELPAVKNMRLFGQGAEPVPTAGPDADAAEQRVRDAWEQAAVPLRQDEIPLQAVKVPSYGVMIMFGFLAAIGVSYVRARAYRIDPNIIIDMGIIAMVAGIAGARLFHIVEYWNTHYIVDSTTGAERTFGGALWEALQIQNGGLVFYGGLIGAALAIFIYLRVRKLPLLFYMDIGAISVPLGLAFGRIGCFLNGCCFGRACEPDFFLATFYDTARSAGDLFIDEFSPVIASQFVASITAFVLFILLTLYYQFVARKRGETLAMLFILYGINRFFVQTLRGDVPVYGDGDFLLTSSQWWSVLSVVLGSVAWYWLRYRRPHELPPRRIGLELERRGIRRLTADGKIPPVPAPPASRK